MKNLKAKSIVILILLANTIYSQTSLTAMQIIENVYTRESGNDMQGDLTMTLINSREDKRVRTIKQYVKDFGSMEKKIMFFESPADVRNTSFMSWSYNDANKSDDQWIYLPALKKVKRISSDSKSDSFMGSDFTYDDLGDRHPSADTHKILREETLNDEQCFVVESISKDKDYMYSRTVSWIIKDKWIVIKKEIYDEGEDLLKTLTVQKFEKISSYWTVLASVMHNIQRNHKTEMKLNSIKLDSGISANMFSERMMKRGIK